MPVSGMDSTRDAVGLECCIAIAEAISVCATITAKWSVSGVGIVRANSTIARTTSEEPGNLMSVLVDVLTFGIPVWWILVGLFLAAILYPAICILKF